MILSTASGEHLDTSTLPTEFEPAFCAECGDRTGWYDTSLNDKPTMICDDCAATLSQEEVTT